jgi:hypothetical protein
VVALSAGTFIFVGTVEVCVGFAAAWAARHTPWGGARQVVGKELVASPLERACGVRPDQLMLLAAYTLGWALMALLALWL